MEQATPVARPRPWPLFLIGVCLFIVGPVLYAVQIWQHQLVMPWHMLILASVGVLCMALSAWQRRGVPRILGLSAFVVLCGLEWAFFVVLARTPNYTGPQPGQPIPKFAAVRADGNFFCYRDLADGHRTVVLFFRGRW